jgi:hypothetical protein
VSTPRYDYTTEKELHYFAFDSVGPKGTIKKVVQYSEMSVPGVFNLGFGDYNEETGLIDDKVYTDNKDARKVLATVVSTIYAFTAKYPTRYVFATGSNEERTKFYRYGVSYYIDLLRDDFFVFGVFKDKTLEDFVLGEDYDAFIITIDEIKNGKVPLVKIDPKLDKFKGKVLFPEKLALANKLLEGIKLPVIAK